jgi:hypothetical protein
MAGATTCSAYDPGSEDESEASGLFFSKWVLLARHPDRLAHNAILVAEIGHPAEFRHYRLWTDEQTDPLQILMLGVE